MITPRTLLLLAAATTLSAPLLRAQNIPHVRGSLDAVTPATQPAADPALPPGHPAAPGAMSGAIPGHPAKPQSPKSGALRIHFTQGTPNAPALGHDPIRVDLLARGVTLKTLRTTLDDTGSFELHDLPLDPPFQPIITITHAGGDQQWIGAPIHKYQPAIEMDLKAFETTAELCPWTIGMRHIIAAPALEKDTLVLRVTEMIGGYNPLDKAWLGKDGTTFSVQLPPTATNIQLGPGLAEAGATITSNTISRGKTMLPGSTQYVFGYDLPISQGKASLSLASPAPTTLFALYVPANASIDKLSNLEKGTASGNHSADGRQLLKAKALKTGDIISVDLSGLTPPAPATQPVQPMEQTTDLHLPVPTKP